MVGYVAQLISILKAAVPRNYTNYLLPIIYYQFEGPAYVCINVHFSFVFSNYVVSTILLVMIAKNIHQV